MFDDLDLRGTVLSGRKKPADNLPDLTTAYDAWKAGDSPETRQAFVIAAQPVLATALQSYGGAAAGNPNLRTQAKLLAVRSLPQYDPRRGSLKNHLLSHLQRLQRIGGQTETGVNMPERHRLAQKHLLTTEDTLRDQLGRDPSDAEMSDHMGVSQKMLARLRQPSYVVTTSQTVNPETGDEAEATSGAGAKASSDSWLEFVYPDLSATDQLVVDHLLGRNGRPKLNASALARKLGVTPAAISQRTQKIQSIIDSREKLFGF